MKAAGIYLIRGQDSGRVYVGSAINLHARKVQHFRELARGTHRNKKLSAAWAAEPLVFTILLVCARANCVFYEQRAIDAFEAVTKGFNIAPKAGSQLGLRHTAETRKKLSAIQRGRKLSPEHKKNIGAAMRGWVPSEATRAKMSAAQMGHASNGFKGPHTTETRKKIAEGHTGKLLSDEHKDRISQACQGIPKPPGFGVKGWETRRKNQLQKGNTNEGQDI